MPNKSPTLRNPANRRAHKGIRQAIVGQESNPISGLERGRKRKKLYRIPISLSICREAKSLPLFRDLLAKVREKALLKEAHRPALALLMALYQLLRNLVRKKRNTTGFPTTAK